MSKLKNDIEENANLWELTVKLRECDQKINQLEQDILDKETSRTKKRMLDEKIEEVHIAHKNLKK